VDVSVNQLEDLQSLEECALEHLAEVNASKNRLRGISHHVAANWLAIKKLDLSQNSMKSVPAELGWHLFFVNAFINLKLEILGHHKLFFLPILP
jgi:hypothetical protein